MHDELLLSPVLLEYRPLVQLRHEDEPVECWYLPAAQSWQ